MMIQVPPWERTTNDWDEILAFSRAQRNYDAVEHVGTVLKKTTEKPAPKRQQNRRVTSDTVGWKEQRKFGCVAYKYAPFFHPLWFWSPSVPPTWQRTLNWLNQQVRGTTGDDAQVSDACCRDILCSRLMTVTLAVQRCARSWQRCGLLR